MHVSNPLLVHCSGEVCALEKVRVSFLLYVLGVCLICL